jgi:DNA-directed RNA polymerase subunit M/transcription elongation factor TFIIS
MDSTMKFCPKCDQLFYLSVEDSVKKFVCHKCGNTEDIEEDCTLSITFCNKPNQSIQNTVNQYTKLDPAAPRISYLKCPKESCVNHQEHVEDREIVYVRYDNIHLKYIYICPKCDTIWESGLKN